MFRRKTIRVERPPEGFAARHGSGAVSHPWRKIERLIESRESMKGALGALHEELKGLYRKEILAYLAKHGVKTRDDTLDRIPRFEREGATFLALPEGWSWFHGFETHHYPDNSQRRTSELRLYSPNEETIAKYSSRELSIGFDEPFKNSDMLMACTSALRKVLPTPEGDQTPVLGIIPGGTQ